jgi:hypothetical protein
LALEFHGQRFRCAGACANDLDLVEWLPMNERRSVNDEPTMSAAAFGRVFRAFLEHAAAHKAAEEPPFVLRLRDRLGADPREMPIIAEQLSTIEPLTKGLRGQFSCLNEARYGIIWGSMGVARDSYECALEYARRRELFDRPIASFQLTRQKLVNMMVEIQKGTMVAPHTGRMKDAGTLRPDQISFGKLNNVREAIVEIAREARTILGGNGVTLDYSPLRHANNLESVRTYEGTDEVHTLTGISAFRQRRTHGIRNPAHRSTGWARRYHREPSRSTQRHKPPGHGGSAHRPRRASGGR